MPQCQATTTTGKPCAATPRPGRPFCAWHDPELAGRRKAWSAKGGVNKSNLQRARRQLPGTVLTMPEIQGYLGKALQDVLAGTVEPGVGTAAASIARTLHQIIVSTELEERVGGLEAALGLKDRSA
jgi:hypothetical protein